MIVTTTVDDGTPTVQTLDFAYDASGMPVTVTTGGNTYYYITNLQGDVMAIVGGNGTVVASYEYDPYGNMIDATGNLSELNPLTYRGYVYDRETQLYYLQSRYYDPELGRFINADAYASTGQGILGNNMFAYCLNNPVNYVDSAGTVGEYFAIPAFYSLSGVFAELMIAVSSAKASIEAALASIAIPVICIAAVAVAVTGIICILNSMRELTTAAEEVVAWAKEQVLAKQYSANQLSGYTVYAIAEKGTTNIVYVGITRSYNSRNYYHQRRQGALYPVESFDMIPIATGLTYKDARALEQILITAFTLKYLDNMINSISAGNMKNFKTEFERMNSLIACCFDTE